MRAAPVENAYKWSTIGSFVLAVSSALALAYFVLGEPLARSDAGERVAVGLAYWMVIGPACWLAVTIGVIAVYHRRGLWVLLGGPIALIPLFAVFWLLSAI